MNDALGQLPTAPADRFTNRLYGSCILKRPAVRSCCSAFFSPSFFPIPPGQRHLGSIEISRSLKHWINDGLMTLFFLLVALELKREIVLGELRNPRMAALSLATALGGMLVPASVYLLLAGGGPGAHGWATVIQRVAVCFFGIELR